MSSDCLQGECQDSDFAATYLQKYRLGYVHAHDGEVFLVDPKSDFWLNGQEGPGFYRQLGGENEKLDAGTHELTRYESVIKAMERLLQVRGSRVIALLPSHTRPAHRPVL